MSLITCPECGKQVSSKAPHCPHCGVPIEHNVKRCPVCNAYVLMSADECPHCNAKFVNKPAAPTPSTPSTPASAANVPPADHGVAPAASAAPAAAGSPAPAGPAVKQGLLESGEGNTPETPRKGKGHTPWYLLVLLILVIAIGGFFYWENQNQQQAEEQAYLLLMDCQDPLNYEDFIAQFPDSKHIDEVRTRLRELQSAKSEFDAALAAGSVQRLRDFIKNHPDSPFKPQALSRIDSLDWLAATTAGSSVAYQLYIDQHENGEHIDAAFVARDEAAKREEQARADSVAAARAKAAAADSVAAAAESTGVDVLVE